MGQACISAGVGRELTKEEWVKIKGELLACGISHFGPEVHGGRKVIGIETGDGWTLYKQFEGQLTTIKTCRGVAGYDFIRMFLRSEIDALDDQEVEQRHFKRDCGQSPMAEQYARLVSLLEAPELNSTLYVNLAFRQRVRREIELVKDDVAARLSTELKNQIDGSKDSLRTVQPPRKLWVELEHRLLDTMETTTSNTTIKEHTDEQVDKLLRDLLFDRKSDRDVLLKLWRAHEDGAKDVPRPKVTAGRHGAWALFQFRVLERFGAVVQETDIRTLKDSDLAEHLATMNYPPSAHKDLIVAWRKMSVQTGEPTQGKAAAAAGAGAGKSGDPIH